jgi:predicted RNase H-like HicB family nuclease
MHKYQLLIYWSEVDQAFLVEVPELAGCMADGKIYLDAVNNAEQIIQEWVETVVELGREVPQPKGRMPRNLIASIYK